MIVFLSVDLREVKEIRVGKNSKDFERWPDDAKRMENMKCFVVFYGLEFRLKTLSIAGTVVTCISCNCLFTSGPMMFS
jgi:hypothetical protein